MELPTVTVKNGAEFTLALLVEPAPGFHLAKEAPSRFRLWLSGEKTGAREPSFKEPFKITSERSETKIRLPSSSKQGVLHLEAWLYFCSEKGPAICRLAKVILKQPYDLKDSDDARSHLELRVSGP